jgi:hypothetical protein
MNREDSGYNRRPCRCFAIFWGTPPQYCRRFLRITGVASDSLAQRRNSAMIRSSGAGGFEGHSVPVASPRLIDAVATALAIGSLSLCLIVTLTVFSIKVSMAMPIPA